MICGRSIGVAWYCAYPLMSGVRETWYRNVQNRRTDYSYTMYYCITMLYLHQYDSVCKSLMKHIAVPLFGAKSAFVRISQS